MAPKRRESRCRAGSVKNYPSRVVIPRKTVSVPRMVVYQLDSEEAEPDTNTACSAPAHSPPGLPTTSLPCHPQQEGTLPTANTYLHHANCKVPRDPVLDSPTRTHSCSRFLCQGWCKVLRRIHRWLQACTLLMGVQAVGQQQGTKALPLVRMDITRNHAGQIAVQARSRALRSSALHRRALLLTEAAFCHQTRASAAGTRGRGSLKHRAPVADANTMMRRVGRQLARAALPASRSPSAERGPAPRARALASRGRLLADRAAGLAREPLVDAGAVEAGVPARQPAQHCARHQLLRARAQRLGGRLVMTQGVRGVHAAPRTATRAVLLTDARHKEPQTAESVDAPLSGHALLPQSAHGGRCGTCADSSHARTAPRRRQMHESQNPSTDPGASAPHASRTSRQMGHRASPSATDGPAAPTTTVGMLSIASAVAPARPCSWQSIVGVTTHALPGVAPACRRIQCDTVHFQPCIGLAAQVQHRSSALCAAASIPPSHRLTSAQPAPHSWAHRAGSPRPRRAQAASHSPPR